MTTHDLDRLEALAKHHCLIERSPADVDEIALALPALIARLREVERELAEVNAFRAEPLKAIRNILGEDECDDEALMGSVCAILLTRQETARRLREATARLRDAERLVNLLTSLDHEDVPEGVLLHRYGDATSERCHVCKAVTTFRAGSKP